MNITRAFRALGPVDAKSVWRDPLIKWLVLLPVMMAVAVRLVVPLATEQLALRAGLDIRPYYPVINGALLLYMPQFVGSLLGLMLLDQRDDQTLTALQVTPLSLNGYFVYRISLPIIMSFLLTLAAVPIAAVEPTSATTLVVSALCAAPIAPVLALFTATVAQNKVQGFAVLKASGVLLVPGLIAYFVAPPLQWVLGVAPTFWPVKTYWLLQAGDVAAWPVLAIGLAYETLLVGVLLHLFNRVMHSGMA